MLYIEIHHKNLNRNVENKCHQNLYNFKIWFSTFKKKKKKQHIFPENESTDVSVHSLVAVFVVRAGVGQVPIGGVASVLQDPTLVDVASLRILIISAIISPASSYPIITQMSSSNGRPVSR